MFCGRCGAFNPEHAIACFQCGQSLSPGMPPSPAYGVPPMQGMPYPRPVEASGKATASLVLGVISLVAWCIPLFGVPISIVGLVLGVKALASNSRGMAIAGVVLSILGLVFALINGAIGAYQAATGQHWLLS